MSSTATSPALSPLEQLQGALDGIASLRTRVVWLVGRPGTGKTKLLHDLARSRPDCEYVPKHWLDSALAVAAGKMDRSAVTLLLATEIAGVEARSKTMIILNRMWLTPHPTLVALAQAGIEIYRTDNAADTLPLHWGMALASHPLFAGIADNIGRLLKLHGEFTALQINRRLKEQLGDRASILRATEAVLQTLTEWQVIREAPDRKRCFVAGRAIDKVTPAASLWLIEACLHASGRSLNLNEPSHLTFPFKLAPLRESDLAGHSRIRVAITGAAHVSVALPD